MDEYRRMPSFSFGLSRQGWGGKEEKMVVGRNKTKEVSSQTPFPSDGSDFRPSEMKIDFLSGLERYMRW